MSKHAPWTDEQAKVAMTEAFLNEADEASRCCEDCRTKLVNADRYFDVGFFAGVAWAAAQIEKCETLKFTIRNGKVHTGSYEVFEAKLVGVREVEK